MVPLWELQRAIITIVSLTNNNMNEFLKFIIKKAIATICSTQILECLEIIHTFKRPFKIIIKKYNHRIKEKEVMKHFHNSEQYENTHSVLSYNFVQEYC